MSAAVKALEKEKNGEINQLTKELQERIKSLDVAQQKCQAFSNEISTLKRQQAALNEVNFLDELLIFVLFLRLRLILDYLKSLCFFLI